LRFGSYPIQVYFQVVQRFADAGHYLLEDAHAELVPLVREFLSRHPLPAPVS
jgi:hypothetical protein